MSNKPRLLTGDTPTGQLHLGHYVGSIENRIKFQDQYQCFFLLANTHAFTTRAGDPDAIYQSTMDIILDYVAAGIDPEKSHIVIESHISAIYQICTQLSMIVPYPRVMRNPTLKAEIKDKGLGDHYPFGFPLYSLLQVADILTFLGELVPVGEDQLPHLELSREIARRFNQMYCGVADTVADADHVKAGGLFPIPEAITGRVKRLVGIKGPNKEGQLLKMSKSLNNAILLSDGPDVVQKKVMSMYTDPTRLKATDPGQVKNNPLWIFHDTFNPDHSWVEETKELYKAGKIGDVVCKKQLIEVINTLLAPMHERRARYSADKAQLIALLKKAQEEALAISHQTLDRVLELTKQRMF